MKKVLVVDDNAVNRKLAVALLKRRGMHVEEAEGGNAALEMLRAGQFDSVLLDISMPMMDGKEVCRILRSTPELAGFLSLPTRRTPWSQSVKASWLQDLMTSWSSPSVVKICCVSFLIEFRNCKFKIRAHT